MAAPFKTIITILVVIFAVLILLRAIGFVDMPITPLWR